MRRTTSLATLALLLGAGACAPIIDIRGNAPNPEQLALVKPGDVNRDDVVGMLGTPSTTEPFPDRKGETWYYISTKTETKAFLAPKVIERNIIAISFDDRGLVKEMAHLTLDDGRPVQLVERETPSAGKEVTLMQQLIGNVGKFSREGPAGRGSGVPGGR